MPRNATTRPEPHKHPIKKRDRVRGIIICIVVTATVELTLGVSWPLLAIALERLKGCQRGLTA